MRSKFGQSNILKGRQGMPYIDIHIKSIMGKQVVMAFLKIDPLSRLSMPSLTIAFSLNRKWIVWLL